MKKEQYTIIIILIGLLCCDVGLCASDRVALVIGNTDYKDGPLKNPVNDANDLSQALGRLGFDVIKKINVTHREMDHSLREFKQKITPNGVALFYYSGYGVQIKGRNYLLPVGQTIYSPEEIRFKSVQADFVLAKMESAGSKVNIVILDACRNNPFEGVRSSSTKGLATMNSIGGMFIMYATAAGSVASDNPRGRNGLFTEKLLETLEIPGLLVEQVFKKVGKKVQNASHGRQLPWSVSQLYDDFYFISPKSTRLKITN
ncbi:MAG: caspase family protein [Candidatus Electrothrix sp. AW5]|nr:caspase family protein [Candidatus Electrothrix gigas]